MTRHTLHVPLTLNDGTPTPGATIAHAESALLDIAGGFTATLSIGAWKAPDGTVYREPVRLYAIDTDADGAADRLRWVAEWIAAELEQEAVYVTAAEIDAELVTSGRVPVSA